MSFLDSVPLFASPFSLLVSCCCCGYFSLRTGEDNVCRTGKSESKANTPVGWSRGRCHDTPCSTWLGISGILYQVILWRCEKVKRWKSEKVWDLCCCNKNPECLAKKGIFKKLGGPACVTHRAAWAEQRLPTGVANPWEPLRGLRSRSSGAWLPWRAGRGRACQWTRRNSAMSPRCHCITPLLLHTHSTHWGTKSWMKRSSCQLRQRQLRKLSHSSFLWEAILPVVSLHTKCGLQQIRQDKIQRVLFLASKTTSPRHYKGGDKWCMCCRDNGQMQSIQDRLPRFFYCSSEFSSMVVLHFRFYAEICRSLWRDVSDLGNKKKKSQHWHMWHMEMEIF